jgi:hypothetical protein
MYHKLIEFLGNELEDTKEEEEKNLVKIWEEKEKFIHETLNYYSVVLEA